MADKLIYLDNAATTFPKPAAILSRMIDIYARHGVSPGRGSYDLAAEASELVSKTRRKVAHFFGAPNADRVIIAGNATDALNIALQGMLRPGDHVVSTKLEHNSVLRPLFHLRQKGIIEYDLVSFDGKGFVNPDDIIAALRPNTRLVVLCHASNVLGTIQPVTEIAHRCRERDVPLLIDAAQSAGVIPIDMQFSQIAAVAFTGHKSLLGPTGVGGLVLNEGIEIKSTRFGGTGFESISPVHTQTFPYRLEAGTLNLLGIIGLSEGLDFLEGMGIQSIHNREMELLVALRDGMSSLEGIEMYCAEDLSNHVAILTVNVRGMDPEDVGAILDADFGIAVRVGLHCAPLVHETLGTSPRGAVRFSLGPLNVGEDIDRTVDAMARIGRTRER
ncbi:MAG: aminotransferase class V-fold PLP-dependent enzyme [Proteobacteria bacterium]|nr:aminotransferase class V-fold PLP-dependent enzyme [Pseudomonadota bacterium]